jgi:hypothetical protein
MSQLGQSQEDPTEEVVGLDAMELLQRFKEIGAEGATQWGSNGMTLTQLKAVAGTIGVKQSQNKGDLVTAIDLKLHNQQKLQKIKGEAKKGGAACDTRGFRKDKNTVPRLLNLLFERPNELQQSGVLASRMQLQDKELNDKCPVFSIVANLFNNKDHRTGGLVARHEQLVEANIDPDAVPECGLITAKIVHELFRTVRLDYAKAHKNYQQSGQHNGYDFVQFCHGANRLDVLYMHLYLTTRGPRDLAQFCQEGHEFDGGVDSASMQHSHSETTSAGSAVRLLRGSQAALPLHSSSTSAAPLPLHSSSTASSRPYLQHHYSDDDDDESELSEPEASFSTARTAVARHEQKDVVKDHGGAVRSAQRGTKRGRDSVLKEVSSSMKAKATGIQLVSQSTAAVNTELLKKERLSYMNELDATLETLRKRDGFNEADPGEHYKIVRSALKVAQKQFMEVALPPRGVENSRSRSNHAQDEDEESE